MNLSEVLSKIALPPDFEPWRGNRPSDGGARALRAEGGAITVDPCGWGSYRVAYTVRDIEVSRVGVALEDLPATVAWTLAAVALTEVV